jgi:hypothetical protein
VKIRVFLLSLLVAALQAQTGQFRFERPINTGVSGPQRLAIDVPLLAGGAPFSLSGPRLRPAAVGGLADLRFFDASGAEVPYLLVQAPPTDPVWEHASVLPIASTKKTSGFEADLGKPVVVDMVRVGGLPAPFLKRLVLEGSGDRQRWTLLAGEGTLFDLPADQLRQTELPFPAGSYRYLRITWDDTNSGRVPLPARVDARRVAGIAPPPPLTAPLSVERRPSEPGRSRYRIRLPGARLPIVSLELQVEGGHVFREASVQQSRVAGNQAVPFQVGRAQLKRIVRDGVSAGTLRIPVWGIVESELDLVVEDGQNPPLPLLGITAIFAELPWIYLETTAGTLTARYGNPSLQRASYDLEAVRERVTVTGLPEAKWGEPRPASGIEAATILPPAVSERGAVIEGGFRHVRPLPGGDGRLVALMLDAATLAHSEGPEGNFADVRVLDAENRQIPYLVERRDEPLPIDVKITSAPAAIAALHRGSSRNRSTYVLELPYDNLPDARLVLETSVRLFQRNVELASERPPDRRRRERSLQVLASGTWTHINQQDPAPALTLAVPRGTARTLILSVDEGDNQPLPLTAARLLLPTYRLRFYHPAGTELRLAYGRDDLAPPRYDLALLAPHVMGAEAREIAIAPASADVSSARASFVTPWMFWLLLGVAVVALLALIARLVLKA